MTCPVVVEVTDPVVVSEFPCLAAEGEVGVTAALLFPDPGISRTLSVPRARVGIGVASGPATATVRLGAVRSASEDGYLGIAGEALVAEVEIASLGLSWARWGLGGRGGVVPDLWASGEDTAWGHGAMVPGFGEAVGWFDRADLGVDARWAHGPFRAAVALTAGEGARMRERNEGKNIAGLLAVVPGRQLAVEIYARNGSRGLGYTRDHRVAVRASGEVTFLRYGASGVAAWGVDGDSTRAPWGGSGWLEVRPWGPLRGLGRVDAWTENASQRDATGARMVGALGVGGTAFEALAGVDRLVVGDAVTSLAGADALVSTTRLFVHVGVRARVDLESR